MNRLLDAVEERIAGRRPAVVGVTGPVAVGKTTVAAILADAFAATVISTDAFLLPNRVLAERDLALRKGFPESYDAGRLEEVLRELRAGRGVDIPVYSHAIYDIVEGARERIEAAGVVVLEGVVALQPPARDLLDVAVYVHAAEDVVRTWFVERFVRWTRDAAEGTFYAGFSHLPDDEVVRIAEMTWDAINAVNLREHIAPSRATADLVVEKAPDHSVAAVTSIDA